MTDRIGETETEFTQSEDTPRRALTLDVERYQSYLDSSELNDDQKRAFVETLWNIIVGFVDLGFDIRPEIPCGQSDDAKGADRVPASDMLGLSSTRIAQDFTASAGNDNDRREREDS